MCTQILGGGKLRKRGGEQIRDSKSCQNQPIKRSAVLKMNKKRKRKKGVMSFTALVYFFLLRRLF